VNLSKVDLDRDSRRALEFNELLERIAGHACTAAGAATVKAISPLARIDDVLAGLAALTEAQDYLEEEGRLVPSRLPDPGPAVGLLVVEGVRLETKMLRGLAVVLEAAATIRTGLLVVQIMEGLRVLQSRGS